MQRITLINKPSDYPSSDKATRNQLGELFETLFPESTAPEFDDAHRGLAIAAHNPQLSLHLAQISKFIALEQRWCSRADLRELAIQTVNTHFKSSYALRARIPIAEAAGISMEQQKAIANWQKSDLFDNEQKLIIRYALAVTAGDVPDDLFEAMVSKYGEQGVVECTTVISFWGFWAMFLNATNPE